MQLQEQLNSIHRKVVKAVPELAARADAHTQGLVTSGIGSEAPRVGDPAPDFELHDQHQRKVRSIDLRAKGPLVVSFYRGSWCPYCNLELRSLHHYLPRISQLGASVVAISPQIPEKSMATVEKNKLVFPVLSDVGNIVARQFGLLITLSEDIRPVYSEIGIDLPRFNGTNTFELPIPATFVVDRHGSVQAEFINADYKKRMEPDNIIKALRRLKGE